MAKFLIRAPEIPEGLQGAVKEGFASREDYLRGLIESLGGKTEAWYFSYGREDVVVIIDAGACGGACSLNGREPSGVVRLNTTPLLTSAEVDAARSQVPQFRAPGAG